MKLAFDSVQRKFKPFVFMLLLAVFVSTSAACMYPAQDRTFWGEARAAGDEVGDLLVQRGLCEQRNKLCGGHVYAITPIAGGFEFYTIGIQDQALLAEIKNIVLNRFNATPKMSQVVIYAYVGDGKPPSYDGAPKLGEIIYKEKYHK